MIDIYVISKKRSQEIVDKFRNIYLANMEESASEYEFPQYSDEPTKIYKNPWELCHRLIVEKKEPHSLYWVNRAKGIIRNAMIFFTTDGAIIFGLSLLYSEKTNVGEYLSHLARMIDGEYGITLFEEPPPETTEEFIGYAKHGHGLRLYCGQLKGTFSTPT